MAVTAKDLHGVMAMMPAFATPDADDLMQMSSVDVENLAAGVDRIIKDGVAELMAAGGGGDGEGGAGKLPVKLAGYVDPGANRTPMAPLTDKNRESAQRAADRWIALCDKYRPLVEAAAAAK